VRGNTAGRNGAAGHCGMAKWRAGQQQLSQFPEIRREQSLAAWLVKKDLLTHVSKAFRVGLCRSTIAILHLIRFARGLRAT
jgi:hypothetical protein